MTIGGGALALRLKPWLLVAIGVATYANSLNGPFIYDDEDTVVNNPHLRQLWPLWHAMAAPDESPVAGRPLVALTFALNYAVGGVQVLGYHALNLAVHLSCALVLYGVVGRTLRCQALAGRWAAISQRIAFGCAAIWMVHPLVTECVNYVTQRSESVMALCYLLTLYCAIRGWEHCRGRRWKGAAVLACAAGMMSKESMVTAPVLVIAYDWAFRSRPYGEVLRCRWRLYVALGATWCLLAGLMLSGPRSDTVGTGHGVTPWAYALNQSVMITRYLALSVWPHPLVLDYGVVRPVTMADAAPHMLAIGALLIVSGAALLRWAKLGFLLACVFLILAPTSSLVPITSEVGAERRMYLPLAALVVLFMVAARGLLVAAAHGNRPSCHPCSAVTKVYGLLTIVIVAALAASTVHRNRAYARPLAIWQSVVEAMPSNDRALNNLGHALAGQGRLLRAEGSFRTALRIDPASVKARFNLANTLQERGQIEQAIGQYEAVLRMKPAHAEALNNIGMAYVTRDRIAEAIDWFQRALEADPNHIAAHNNLANAFAGQGQTAEAIRHYQLALTLDSNWAEIHSNLGAALLLEGRIEAAERHLRRAIHLEPSAGDARRSLGALLLSQGHFEQATVHLDQALRLDSARIDVHLMLGKAHQALGHFQQATRHYQEVLLQDPQSTQARENLAAVKRAAGEYEGLGPENE